MLTRSARALPLDFNANQPVGRRLKPNAAEERRQIVHFNPTLPAAFPTLERPPPPPQRQLWARGASAALDDGPKNKRRRIDMTEDDLYNELLGDNTFLNAQPGCKEAEMPLFGEGDYKLEVEYNEDNKVELNPPSLDDLNPGEFGLPLFYDKEKIILDVRDTAGRQAKTGRQAHKRNFTANLHHRTLPHSRLEASPMASRWPS